MRVLVLASFFPKPGNPAMGVWALRQAEALQRSGAEVAVVSLTSWVPRLLGRGRLAAWARCPPAHRWSEIPVVYPRWPVYDHGPVRALLERRPGVALRGAWPAAREGVTARATAFAPDVVHAEGSLVNGWVGTRLLGHINASLVVHEHDNDEVSDPRPARRRHLRSVVAMTHTVVVPSHELADRVRAAAPGASVTVIPNGADLTPRTALAASRPAAWDDRAVVLAAAGFLPRKRLPTLVEAFALVAPGHPEAVLRIIGDGPDRPAVEATIDQLRLADRVELAGRRSHPEVLQEMAWADVFALPSVNEPFGVVFLEALGAGTPVICTADAGATDVIEHGVHGLVVPPDDTAAVAGAIARLLEDRSLRERMGAAGREHVAAHLTWDAHGRALAAVLDQARASTR